MHMITQDLHRKKEFVASHYIGTEQTAKGSLGEILPYVSPQSDIHMWRKSKVFATLSHLFYLTLAPFGILVEVTFFECCRKVKK